MKATIQKALNPNLIKTRERNIEFPRQKCAFKVAAPWRVLAHFGDIRGRRHSTWRFQCAAQAELGNLRQPHTLFHPVLQACDVRFSQFPKFFSWDHSDLQANIKAIWAVGKDRRHDHVWKHLNNCYSQMPNCRQKRSRETRGNELGIFHLPPKKSFGRTKLAEPLNICNVLSSAWPRLCP